MKKQFPRFSRSPRSSRQPSRYSNVQQRAFRGDRRPPNVQESDKFVEREVMENPSLGQKAEISFITANSVVRTRAKKHLYLTPGNQHSTVSRSRLRCTLLHAHLQGLEPPKASPTSAIPRIIPKTTVDLPEPSVDEITLPPTAPRIAESTHHQHRGQKRQQQQEQKSAAPESLRAPKHIVVQPLTIEPVELPPGVTLIITRAQHQIKKILLRQPANNRAEMNVDTGNPDGSGIKKQVQQAVSHILSTHTLLERGTTLVCAVSGGSDSVALLDVLTHLAAGHGLTVVVAHVNHRLRGKEADEDEIFVQTIAQQSGWDYYGASVNVRDYARDEKLSIEAAARAIRYKFLEYVAYTTSAQAVVTAHILDDSVETFLLNLVRGSGLTGLGGIQEIRPFAQIAPLVRPLLHCKKEQVRQYCIEQALEWREDSSNALSVYTRNKIRHQLLPLLEQEFSPAIVDVLHRTSQIIRQADLLVSTVVDQSARTVIEDVHIPNSVCFRIEALHSLAPFVRNELFHRIIQERLSGDRLSFEALERIVQLLWSPLHTQADINKRLVAIRDREHIVVTLKSVHHTMDARIEKNNDYDFPGCRIVLREVDRKKVRFSSDPAVEFLDSELLPYRLTLRTWKPGDKFQPLGMSGTMSVSDYLSNSKVSFLQRQQVLVLATSSDIVCICGMRINERYKVSHTTQKALRLEFRTAKHYVS